MCITVHSSTKISKQILGDQNGGIDSKTNILEGFITFLVSVDRSLSWKILMKQRPMGYYVEVSVQTSVT